ncbi:SDR family NAD(P)-dependent oxidoreductase [Nocardia seriolae]|uniref:3-hydroxybutyrate dehydrogenase n=1 Tax=Nocardia seriolae TaxID=37332 RepID=A0A0B8NAA0_9NOCA|nr:SDR family NAD(P)-dependent oxidoreductase [Nocardia seriolae]APB00072.1 3-hydroxybutyrate dehydrogenase [Nocardia seriolae]MTJ64748.1 SDR family NAD(P)-dependent oxidoreductase [Nocardia seriolae]MTJ74173.1 SDR family NAD(P)-dependent oxidoreductase [Nocardia seriolae]MTJ89588.1 SDR family NAD(P)-dependent oxidoreductase [Nocardia seriolae]MTK33562.1 SDR family NAD(P)-dependent oxidoreductase [Nocardia seriolae]
MQRLRHKPFHPEIAVVTGAGSGIGRGTAKALAARGAEVVVADINFATANDTVALIRSAGGSAFPYALDVGDPFALEAFAEYVESAHGVPDVVVNNAGIVVGGPFFEIRPADLHRIAAVNLTAIVHGCKLFGAQMAARGRGGQLVNVSSMAAFAPMRLGTPYAFTSAAVRHFSETLRTELAAERIGVTVVCPGLIATNLAATATLATLRPEQVAITRQLVVKGMTLLGMHPDRAGRKIVEAAEHNRALVPLRLESWLAHRLTRAFPRTTRTLMRVITGPEVDHVVRFVIDHPGFLGVAREAAEIMPQRRGLQTYWEPPEYDDPPAPPIPLRR